MHRDYSCARWSARSFDSGARQLNRLAGALFVQHIDDVLRCLYRPPIDCHDKVAQVKLALVVSILLCLSHLPSRMRHLA
jgi:hypothetical protein